MSDPELGSPARARSTDDGGRHRRLLGVGAAALVLVLVLRFAVVSPAAASWFVIHLGYWTTLVAFAIFVGLAVRWWRTARVDWRRHGLGGLAVLLGTVVLQVGEPHRLRVMYDEYTLLTTSLGMHRTRSAATVSYALSDARGGLEYLDPYVEKRQLFFPFLLSLVHDVSGYRPANAFVLNAVVGVAFLGGAYLAGCVVGGTGIGILGVLLAAGLPLAAQSATGGGYDLLNVTLVLLLFVQAVRHQRVPSCENAELLVAIFILAAQVRDETMLLGLLVAAAIGWGWWRTRRVTMSWYLALAPLLLLTPLLINLIFLSTPAFFGNLAQGVDTFGAAYFRRNVIDACHYLYNWNGQMTNSPLLSWLGTAALLGGIVAAGRDFRAAVRAGDPLLLLAGFAGFGVGFFGLVLFYFWGQLTDPVAARLCFPLQAIFLLAILCLAARMAAGRWPLRAAQAAAGLFLLAYAVPVNARHAATSSIALSREAEWAVDYARRHTDPATLFIARSALPFICNGRPAILTDFLAQAPAYFDSLCDNPVYREVLVLEVYRPDPATNGWVPLHAELTRHLAQRGLALEPVAEQVFQAGYESRLSRLVRRPAGR